MFFSFVKFEEKKFSFDKVGENKQELDVVVEKIDEEEEKVNIGVIYVVVENIGSDYFLYFLILKKFF